MLPGKRGLRNYGIKVANRLTLKYRDYLWLSWWGQWTHKGPYMEKEEAEESESEEWHWEKDWTIYC